MAESYVQIDEGKGKKLHAYERSVGGNTVYDSISVIGEPIFPTYVVSRTSNTSVATANDVVLQIMAGASLALRIRRIKIWQSVLASAAGIGHLRVNKLSSAGTGGTNLNVRPLDPASPAAGASAMVLPTAAGTIDYAFFELSLGYRSAAPAGGPDVTVVWEETARGGSIVIPAGTSNGIAIENKNAVTGASVRFIVEFDEVSY